MIRRSMGLIGQEETTPAVSVVIASYNARATIERCLASLTSVSTAVPFEIDVVDSSEDGTAEMIGSNFPKVTVVKVATRLYPGDARNLGVEKARADIMAFTDTDCIADARWLDEIVEAQRTGVLAVGGSVTNGNPQSMISWANYFCEFTAWMPTGHVRAVPA